MVYIIYIFTFLTSLAILKTVLGEYFPLPMEITLLPFLSILAFIIFKSFKFIEKFKKEKAKKERAILKKESQLKKREIEKIYKKLKDTKHKGVYDKKVFILIDTLNQLNEEHLYGHAKNRVQEVINKSLNLYIVNLKMASKMIEASKLDLDLEDEIQEIVKQNKEIMNKLKESLTKLILLDQKDLEFEKLIHTFEKSLKTLEIIKEGRNNE